MGALPADGTDLLMEAITQSTDYAVVLVDSAGRIDGWTGAAHRLFGYSAAEIVGSDYASIFVPEDVELELHRQEMAVAAASQRSEDDRWHLRKDGTRFWGSGVLQAVGAADGGAPRYCKLVRDRSDIRTRTEGLENEKDRLMGELRRRTEFTATLVHELRAPLAPIASATYLLGATTDPAIRARALEVLKRQTALMVRHLEDLYETSRASLGLIGLQIETLVANDALLAAVEDARAAAVSKGIDLQLVVPEHAITVEADPQRLQQMVGNLLSNALKYTPPGGRVVASVTAEGRDLVIRVEDNGAGIDPAVLPLMFELFTREDRKGEQSWPQGLGVGLALVKTLADRHRGTVEGRSLGRNRGSVFALRLPLVQPGSAQQ